MVRGARPRARAERMKFSPITSSMEAHTMRARYPTRPRPTVRAGRRARAGRGTFNVGGVSATASFRLSKWMPRWFEVSGAKVVIGGAG